MGLLEKSGATPTADAPLGAKVHNEAPKEAGGTLAVKRSSAYEYQKKLKQKMRDGAKRILDNPAIKLDAVDKAFLEWLNREPGTGQSTGGNFGTPIFNKLFGNKPAVGAMVTLQEVFDKTYKGKAQMDSLMKKWKEKSNVDIAFKFNADKPALSTYTIISLGSAF